MQCLHASGSISFRFLKDITVDWTLQSTILLFLLGHKKKHVLNNVKRLHLPISLNLIESTCFRLVMLWQHNIMPSKRSPDYLSGSKMSYWVASVDKEHNFCLLLFGQCLSTQMSVILMFQTWHIRWITFRQLSTVPIWSVRIW